MKYLNILIFTILLFSSAFLHAVESKKSVLSTPPWPFPWAKECDMDWVSLEGRYHLVDSPTAQSIELAISVLNENGLKLVRISSYTTDGSADLHGFTIVTESHKAVHLYLTPYGSVGTPIWIGIQMYYTSAIKRCAPENLVPILTMDQTDAGVVQQVQYKMVKVQNSKK